jgi:hypothetical protein
MQLVVHKIHNKQKFITGIKGSVTKIGSQVCNHKMKDNITNLENSIVPLGYSADIVNDTFKMPHWVKCLLEINRL